MTTPIRRAARLGAALASVAALVLAPLALAPAAADIPTTISHGDFGLSYNYVFSAGTAPDIAYPYRVRSANGSVAIAYCVERPIGTENGAPYTEGTWDGIAGLEQVNWILANGAPEVSNEDLSAAVQAFTGSASSYIYDDFMTRGVTQWAIWHFTDDFDISRVTGTVYQQIGDGPAVSPVAMSALTDLYDYLIDPSTNVGIPEPSETSLQLDASGAAWTGENFGPVVVHTNAPHAELSVVAGEAHLVDAGGSAVSSVADGTSVYLHAVVGTTGTASIAATADGARIPLGRVLVSPGLQALISAQTVTDVADAALDVVLSPELPSTGADAAPGLALAAAMLLGGAALLLLVARRRVGRHSL